MVRATAGADADGVGAKLASCVEGTALGDGAAVWDGAAAPVVEEGPPPHAPNDTATRMVATRARTGARRMSIALMDDDTPYPLPAVNGWTVMERVYTTPLIDKLGIRPGMRVALIDIDDEAIRPLIADRTSDITEGWPAPDTDVVLLGADSMAQLGTLRELSTRIRPNGAIWVVWRKGKSATLRDVDVIGAGKGSGLVDNKVVAFSATHTAFRLVIPVALRPR